MPYADPEQQKLHRRRDQQAYRDRRKEEKRREEGITEDRSDTVIPSPKRFFPKSPSPQSWVIASLQEEISALRERQRWHEEHVEAALERQQDAESLQLTKIGEKIDRILRGLDLIVKVDAETQDDKSPYLQTPIHSYLDGREA